MVKRIKVKFNNQLLINALWEFDTDLTETEIRDIVMEDIKDEFDIEMENA